MKNAAEDTFFKMKKFINCHGKLLDFSTPKVMGILNLTPDSFYDGGKYDKDKEILEHVSRMIEDGADIVDLGAQSTRPGALRIHEEDEWKRLESPLQLIRNEFPSVIISVDTFYADVAAKAVGAGADMINDVSGGTIDNKMFATIAGLKVPYILMHMRGIPETMQNNPHYENALKDIILFFSERIRELTTLGAHDIIIDPGFGFGKNMEHNYTLLKHLDHFRIMERPIMAGLSRKSMVSKTLGVKTKDTLNGTTVLHTIALMKGANIIRVHDVKEAVETIKLVQELVNAQ